jgi:hypothetical protein
MLPAFLTRFNGIVAALTQQESPRHRWKPELPAHLLARTYKRTKFMVLPNSIEILTLFVDDINEAKTFYSKVFAPVIVYPGRSFLRAEV